MNSITLEPVTPSHVYVVLLDRPNGKQALLSQPVGYGGIHAARTFTFLQDAENFRESPKDVIQLASMRDLLEAIVTLQCKNEPIVGFIIDRQTEVYPVDEETLRHFK